MYRCVHQVCCYSLSCWWFVHHHHHHPPKNQELGLVFADCTVLVTSKLRQRLYHVPQHHTPNNVAYKLTCPWHITRAFCTSVCHGPSLIVCGCPLLRPTGRTCIDKSCASLSLPSNWMVDAALAWRGIQVIQGSVRFQSVGRRYLGRRSAKYPLRSRS